MRYTSATLLLALPAIVAAREQVPLKDVFVETVQEWFDKAASYIPGAVSSPIDTAAGRVAAEKVTPLTKENWASVLAPSAASSVSDGPAAQVVQSMTSSSQLA